MGVVITIPEGTKYPELHEIAGQIAEAALVQVGNRAQAVESEMPYKAQFILEETIKILERSV